MDLRKFIQYHQSHNSLDSVCHGFEVSSFIDPTNEIPALVKQILSSPKLTSDLDKQKLLNQLQSGGVAQNKTEKTQTQKKQSFCTEFNQMILNILGLIAFDFSKYLYFLFGMEKLIEREIKYISEARTYKEILDHVTYISNIFALGEKESNTSPIDISEDFYTTYYSETEYKSLFGSDEAIDRQYVTLEIKSKKRILFDNLIDTIRKLVKIENIISFEDDKREWVDLLNTILSHTVLGTYNINNIDDLILNLGPYDVCYDKSFIKMFDVLYDESFAQIPSDLKMNYFPHIDFINKELNIETKCSNYLNGFSAHFNKIYLETLKSVEEVMDSDKILTINISKEFYDRLSNITLNLYVQLCKKIANNQQVYAYVGRSTRIQFSQVLNALMDCTPRNTLFTRSQFATIYYILLSRKVLNESVHVVCGIPFENAK